MAPAFEKQDRYHIPLLNGLKKYLIPEHFNSNIALSFKNTLYSIFLYFARDEYNSATVWTEAASQNASQACTFGTTLVLLWFTVRFISLYFAVINVFVTRTYKPQSRTENPCVGGSNPPLPIGF